MRKLATAAFSFSVAIFLARYIFPFGWLPWLCVALTGAAFTGLFFRGFRRLRIIIIFLSLAAGIIWSWTYTAIFIKPSWYLHEETSTISAVITDYPSSRIRRYRVDAEIKQNGRPSVGLRLYYYNETMLQPGDLVEFTASFRRTDGIDDSERFDSLSSRGAFLSGYVSGEIRTMGMDSGLRYVPLRFANSVAGSISKQYPEDVSGFMQALLVGKRDSINSDTSLSAALSASGIIHVVSISGMHVSFLVGFLGVIIKNKRGFAFFGIPLLLFFMAMTGFTPSITRAGIMQIFLICAPLFKRESDSITSLAASLMVLLAFNPYSCASVGLQLSFAATFGIILFTSRIYSGVTDVFHGKRFYRNRVLKAIVNFVVSSLATTIGALIFTLPLTVIHFGYISLVAPLTNLLTLWAVSLTFPLGLCAAILTQVFAPLATIASFPVIYAVRYILVVAQHMAALPYSVIYSSNTHLVAWLAYIYTMFITLPLMRARARQYFYPACLSAILLCAVILLSPLFPTAGASSITVLDVGQGMSVVINTNEHYALVDCGSNSGENAGAIAHEHLLSQGRTTIDLLILTHFHSDHVNGVEYLLALIDVAALVIPDPDGSYLADDIIELARKRGTDIIYITETFRAELDDITIVIYPPMGTADENERGLSVLALGGINALITGDMNASSERALLRYAALPYIDLLVVGHHGSRFSTSEELLAAVMPKVAVIPVGRNNYGHPSDETIERLESFSVTVYRTDTMGHVTVNGN